MKILLITPFYAPGVGGSSRLLHDIVEHLRSKAHDIDVVTFGDPSEQKIEDFDSIQNYPIHRIKPQSGAGLSTLLVLLTSIKLCFSKRYDLILCGTAYPSALVARVVNRLFRIPFVIYTHGEDVSCVQTSQRKAKALTDALRHAAFVMANSNHSLAEARNLGASIEHSEVCPPSIDPEPYENADPNAVLALKQKLGLNDSTVILTVARLQARKGHDTVIRALGKIKDQLSNVQYLIVGKGDQTSLRALAESEGISDIVRIVDYVSDDDLPLLYHVCDIYCMVSRWDPVTREVEGFGMVYIEAGASGKPCIAGSAGGCADAVEDGVTGFVVNPESYDHVAVALQKLLSDKSLGEKMAKAGRERVRDKFSKQTVLPRIAEIVESVGKHR